MRVGIFLPLVAAIGAVLFHPSLEAAHGVSQPRLLARPKDGDFHSQANQDEFVHMLLYGLLDKQDKGCYLEIGAGEPVYINNSYFFEKRLQWGGVSIDISTNLGVRWRAARTNLLLIEDATKSDYSAILSSFPKVIDYLSLDIDEKYDAVLEKLFCADHVFKIITIEHDAYRYGDFYRQKERRILSGLGYCLLCADVSSFEDWWVHPSFFPAAALSTLTSLDLNSKKSEEIIQKIKSAIRTIKTS